jgi:hypothetical protein
LAKGKKSRRNPKKRNPKHSKKRRLAAAKANLLRAPEPNKILSVVRSNLDSSDYEEFFSWISQQPALASKALADPFPKAVSDLRPHPAPYGINPFHEMKWCFARLKCHFDSLKTFTQYREELDFAIVNDDEELAQEKLKLIEECYGQSIWLIKKKISFLQRFQGLESQKEYAKSIKDQGDSVSGLVTYLTHFISYRSEETVTPEKFVTEYEAALESLGLDNDIASYLRYQITNSSPSTISECAGIVGIEAAGTAIDSYEMLVAALQEIASRERFIDLKSAIAPMVRALAEYAQDARMRRVLHLYFQGLGSLSEDSWATCNWMALLMDEEASDQSHDLKLPNRNAYLHVLNALWRCLRSRDYKEAKDQNRLSLDVAIRSVIFGEGEQHASRAFLLRAAWATEGGPAAWLFRLLVAWANKPRLALTDRRIWERHVAGLGSPSPFELWWCSRADIRNRLIDQFESELDISHEWLALERNEVDRKGLGSTEPQNPFMLWREMYGHVRLSRLDSALDIGKSLFSKQKNPFIQRQAAIFITACLAEREQWADCVVFSTTAIARDSSLQTIIPVQQLYQSLPDQAKFDLTGELSYPVFVDLYTSNLTQDQSHLKSYAAEDFLTHHSLRRPSDIRSKTEEFDSDLLVYFLRFICIESVMDTWIMFETSHEVVQERSSICQLLTEIDSHNKEVYQAEIRSLMQRVTLSRRMREVEQSKIHVDVDSVKKVARETLKESYARYQAFLKTGMTPDEKEQLRQTGKRIAQGEVEALLSASFPRNEMSDLLERIVVRLRDEFVSSSQHGLDGYLSVRVRHGTLAGQIRGPLESEKLVTTRDSETQKYKLNTYWEEALGLKDSARALRVQDSFSSFSESIDSLIEEIKSTWLQVRRIASDAGLINFILLRPEVHYISTNVREDMEFDDFLDLVIEFFFKEKLEPSLSDVRVALQNNAKPRINELLLKLQTDLEAELSDNEIWRVRQAIGQARTQLQNVLDRVTEWFRLTRAEITREPFSIEEAVSIGEASIQAAAPEFKVRLHSSEDLDSFRISGKLASFVDLLFIAFENAVRHGCGQGTPLVDVWVDVSDNYLQIRVENELEEGGPSSEALQNIEAIRRDVQSNVFSDSVATEGGTGFYKMQKTLHHDFSGPGSELPELDFGVFDENKWFVRTKIPFQSWRSE